MAETSLSGQLRWNAKRTESIFVFGAYGYGSGGTLYAVSIPYSVSIPRTYVRSPNGMSEVEILKSYPNRGFISGDRVQILRSIPGLGTPFGVVTEVVYAKNGCLVRPEGKEESFGWGFEELQHDERSEWPTRFERPDPLDP